ncbi:MAG: ribulose-phosphate 3-epimerase [Ignavibacteria bacterium]|nr:ribulose-phosphate 3-epimerase [Ignavibacteria bacterium]
MKYIAPSLLSADFANLAQQIRTAEIGGADIIHCDVMDGRFVPNITFGPFIVEAVRRVTKLPLDVHLMIKDPQNYIEQFAEAGANYISVHQEEAVHLNSVINKIKNLGVKAGVVLNPATPINTLDEILSDIDFVLIMSVNPGFGGQSFIQSSISKIERLSKLREERGLNFLIEIDGGIDSGNIKSIADAGCDIFVAGSTVFKADNIAAAVTELRNLANK